MELSSLSNFIAESPLYPRSRRIPTLMCHFAGVHHLSQLSIFCFRLLLSSAFIMLFFSRLVTQLMGKAFSLYHSTAGNYVLYNKGLVQPRLLLLISTTFLSIQQLSRGSSSRSLNDLYVMANVTIQFYGRYQYGQTKAPSTLYALHASSFFLVTGTIATHIKNGHQQQNNQWLPNVH